MINLNFPEAMSCPTDLTILGPRNLEKDELIVFQRCRSTDFEALKWRNVWSGDPRHLQNVLQPSSIRGVTASFRPTRYITLF